MSKKKTEKRISNLINEVDKGNYLKGSKFTLDNIADLSKAFASGADVSAACSYANISRQTYYNWINKHQKLKERIDNLRENPVLKAYVTVFNNLDDVETAKWLLERKRKEEFSKKLVTENSHTTTEADQALDILNNLANELYKQHNETVQSKGEGSDPSSDTEENI